MVMLQETAPANDAQLLEEFVQRSSQAAFAELARRYLPLIYSSAMRQTRDPDLAQDVAQATLIVLARKAHRISPEMLPGWVVNATYHTARNALRQKKRREFHEQRAAQMQSEQKPSECSDRDAIAEKIDEALARLREKDRTPVVMRFFEGKSFTQISQQLGISEQATQKRLSRAVEKLRGIMTKGGINIAPAFFAEALANQQMHEVPHSLTSSTQKILLQSSSSATIIAKGAMYSMALNKATVAVGLSTMVLLAATPAVYYGMNRPPAVDTAVLAAGTPTPAVGKLPAGMTVQVIGVMNFADKKWKTPDGQEINDKDLPVNTRSMLQRVTIPGAKFAVLLRHTAPDGISWIYSVTGAAGRGGTSTNSAGGVTYDLMIIQPEEGATSLNIGVKIATGDWQVTTIPPKTANSITDNSTGTPIVFDPPVQQDNGIEITQHGAAGDAGYARLLAIGKNGKEVRNTAMRTEAAFNQPVQVTYMFPRSLDDYQNFEFRSRKFDVEAEVGTVQLK